MDGTLSLEEAKRFYDRFGAKQDSQGFYEDLALTTLIGHAAFEHAEGVFELGCGTGRFAERLLSSYLGQDCRYTAVDCSTTMVSLAQTRLARFGERVAVYQGGADALAALPAAPDRIVSTYVLDLLSDTAIAEILDASRRALTRHGRLCLVGLTFGETLISRVISAAWHLLFRLSPRTVGGCRPIRLAPRFDADGWRIVHHSVVTSCGVPSEVLVAEKADRAAGLTSSPSIPFERGVRSSGTSSRFR